MKNKALIFKPILVVILIISLIMSLAACGASNAPQDANQSKTESKIPLKISHQPYLHALPGVYAEKNGMYDPFDYTVSIYASGPTQNEAIASKAWDVGVTGTGGAILGASGYNLKVIGFSINDTNTVDLWVRPDSPLAKKAKDNKGVFGTGDDWKGKEILCPTGTSCQMALIGTLEHLSLSQKDVKVVDMGVAQSFPAFKAGKGDIVALWSPFGFQAEKEGWVKVSSAKDLGLYIPCVIVATEDAVKNKPEAVQKWLQVYLDAADKLVSDKAAAATMLYDFEKEQGIKMDMDAAKLDIESRVFPTKAENRQLFKKDADGSSEAQKVLLKFADFLISQGKLKQEDKQKMINSQFVDSSFMEKING